MDKDPYKHIHHATDKHLAELLRGIIAMKDANGRCYFQKPQEAIEIVGEAARRLENHQPRDIFNHEAFSANSMTEFELIDKLASVKVEAVAPFEIATTHEQWEKLFPREAVYTVEDMTKYCLSHQSVFEKTATKITFPKCDLNLEQTRTD